MGQQLTGTSRSAYRITARYFGGRSKPAEMWLANMLGGDTTGESLLVDLILSESTDGGAPAPSPHAAHGLQEPDLVGCCSDGSPVELLSVICILLGSSHGIVGVSDSPSAVDAAIACVCARTQHPPTTAASPWRGTVTNRSQSMHTR